MRSVTRSLWAVCLAWVMLLASPPLALAITPCPKNPCQDGDQPGCEQLVDWVAEGVVIELRYRSEETKPTIIPGFPVYHTLLRELVFVPEKTLKGSHPPGEAVLTPYRICWPAPEFKDLRPARLRVYVQQSAQGGRLVHFERLSP